jgi:hypothetical protein
LSDYLGFIPGFGRLAGANQISMGASMAGPHKIVPSRAWIETCKKFLLKAKEFTRLRDQLSQQRCDLPFGEIRDIGDRCSDWMRKILDKDDVETIAPHLGAAGPNPQCAPPCWRQDEKNRGPKAAVELYRRALRYGVSTRTMVGFGNPAMPPYATEPRYFVPAPSPLKVRLIAAVVPSVAAAGAVTVMLPASAVPSTHA